MHKTTKGFTLIELLVVITIIGILSVTVTVLFDSPRSKAKDAVIISDMKWFTLGMEVDKSKISNRYASSATLPASINGSEVPANNSENSGVYYWADNTSNADSFCVWGVLNTGTYLVSSNGITGTASSAPTSITDCEITGVLAEGGGESESGPEVILIAENIISGASRGELQAYYDNTPGDPAPTPPPAEIPYISGGYNVYVAEGTAYYRNSSNGNWIQFYNTFGATIRALQTFK